MALLKTKYLLSIAAATVVIGVVFWLVLARSTETRIDRSSTTLPKQNFRLIHYASNGKRAIDVLRSLPTADVYSLTSVATKDELQFDQGKTLLTRLPHVSSEDSVHLHFSKSYAGSYFDVFSGSGEALFINKYTRLLTNEPLIWMDSNSSYLRTRQPLTSILTGSDTDRKHRRSLIVAPCLFDKVPCALFTYRYDGFSDTRINSTTALSALIGVLNFIKAYLEKHDVIYYMISADSHVYSVAWQQIVKRIFPDDYTSPTFADDFITCNYSDGGLYTTDFVLVSRSLVPSTASLRFNLRDLTFASSDQRYAILAEISRRDNDANHRSTMSQYDEKTLAIMRLNKTWRSLRPHINVEPTTFDVTTLDYNQVANMLYNNELKRLIPINQLLT